MKNWKTILAACVLAFSANAHSATIHNFDDLPQGFLGGSFNRGINSYNGYDFYNPYGNTTIYASGYSGSRSYLNGNGGNTTITRSDGGLFSFEGFWTKSFSSYHGVMGILGYLDGNLVASQGFTSTSSWTYVSATDPAFNHINAFTLLFYGGAGYNSIAHRYIDDIHFGEVSAVPVPAAVWLFGSGLVGLIGFARRKKV